MIQSQQSNLSPQIQRLYQEANAAWEQQDYKRSLSLIEKATRKDPSNPSILLELARVHGLRYDFAAAESCLEKAVKLSRNPILTLEEAARICLDFDNLDMAIRYFQRATRKKEASIPMLVTLADIYIREGRVEEASELVARAAQMDPKDPRVLLHESALCQSRGNGAEAEALLRELLHLKAATPVRIRALYALAGLLDRQGQYDEAMSALLEAKALQRAGASVHIATRQLIQNRTREMEQTITGEALARWRADAPKLQPSRRIAVLCGHPRSGTTLLEQILDSHSDVTSAEETKIMHDEAYQTVIRDLPEGTSILKSLEEAPVSVLCRARENYFQCTEKFLRRTVGDRLLMDKNPGLNVMIPIVVRIFPEAKFIIALRDPRDVIISCFQQALPMTPISSAYLSLEETVRQYASVMGFWLDMRSRLGDQWIEVRYERLIEDLPTVAHSVLDFLGLRFEEKVLQFYEHARTRRVSSPSHADVQRPIYKTAVGRWRNYQKYLTPHLMQLEPFLKAFNYF